MISTDFAVRDDGLLDAYQTLCLHAEDFVNTVTNRTVNDTADEILVDFQQEPPLPSGAKIEWTSEKQHRFVMVMKRKGLIKARHERQHRVSKGWRIGVVYTPGQMSSVELWNEEDATTFVEGIHQQPFLEKIGWLNAVSLSEKWGKVLESRIEDDLIVSFYAVGEGVR